MNARERILNAVSSNKPALVPLPEININRTIDRSTLTEQFVTMLTRIGGKTVLASSMDDIKKELNDAMATGDTIVNTVAALSDLNNETLLTSDATALEPVYKAYVEGTIGVAENGSVWLDESKIINRLLPFICQHLIIVLRANRIVADMHEAYKAIDAGKEGYGVFLAGPSKTADIEQSLVIGAHGARSLLVYLLQD
ncbi:MAG: LUD domain-containing protein [Chitinophagaceae bacterium]|nr:LUD domain-containing protein [Chitinophagaceae bacterium]